MFYLHYLLYKSLRLW